MLLRLPVELVERIVRFAVPQYYSFDNYPMRQNTLCSLCLVCRDLLPLARRLLGECFKVYDPKRREPTYARSTEAWLGEPSNRTRLRTLAIIRPSTTIPSSGYLALQDARFSEIDDLDISWLAELPSLTHLAIASCVITVLPQVLPTVALLSCEDVAVRRAEQAPFLSPSTFPALQSLAFSPRWSNDTSVAIKPTDALTQHLASLVVNDDDADLDTAHDWPLLLVRFRIFSRLSDESWNHIKAIRYAIYSALLIKPEGQAASLFDFAQHLSPTRTPSIALQRLYLPSHLDPASCNSLVLPAVQACLRACASRGIVVEFDEISQWVGDSHVSRKFAAYATEQRAKKVQEEAAKAK
ncbi:hypothetical protein JCM10213_002767 [Rhodosporidiobolus nylandii]